MAIKIKNLERIANSYTELQYIYKDLFLDLAKTNIVSPGTPIPIPGFDVKATFDIGAIKSSLQNLFGTSPGQRFLFPEYGLDLRQYLFYPINEGTGEAIKNKINTAIRTWEPRVQVNNILVAPEPDKNQYVINIILDIPSLSLNTTLNGLIDTSKQSFLIL
jgi:phage baseplate assembly protein W